MVRVGQATALLPLVRGSKHNWIPASSPGLVISPMRGPAEQAKTDARRYPSTLGSARRVVTNHHPSPFRRVRAPGSRWPPSWSPAASWPDRPAPRRPRSPYERGPAPTTAILEASRGPFATASQSVSSLSVTGFGGGVIYYPTSTSEGTFGAIAISPGYTAAWSSISWLGPRIASHGFVVIGIETNTIWTSRTAVAGSCSPRWTT